MAGGRPLKLDSPASEALKSRAFIARTTDLFSLADIARGFDIGINTLRRYVEEHERQDSLKRSSVQYANYKEKASPRQCHYCKLGFRNHVRCKDCNQLLHDVTTYRNGGTPDWLRCYSCFYVKLRTYGLD